jgi:D-alanine-D-alanine ligase
MAVVVDGQTNTRKILHLIGSRHNAFYYDLSLLYARACDACPDLDRSKYEFHYAVVHLDGTWSFPASLSEEDVEKSKSMSFAAAMARVEEMDPDVMVPHMFDMEGMTRYRSLFDLMQIPFLGNHEYSVWPAEDKAATNQLLAAAGVTVPSGDLLVKGQKEWPTKVQVPFVVKPVGEANSRGITLVRKEEDALAAIEYAFSFDSRVLVDEYIAGREMRAACIENDNGELVVLPKIEYFLDDIRTAQHKLATDASGKLTANAIKAAKKDGDRQCPADLSEILDARVNEAVKAAHRALKCRHYSLFDLRIDANEQPFIIEACLFCSFSPLSVIPAMAQHAGDDLKHPKLFHMFLDRAASEKDALRGSVPSTACGSERSVSVGVEGSEAESSN